ncbi:SCO2525 family SAM-dependent methyltransferase [Streptomyces sp. NBC_01723]|uniref:SCO2525 family SAM-dependent methyltransferase n=1 Tax=unclassified Streptomyces TaxID=2593676 RepID=UPI0027845CDF|nr:MULTISPECIES: SCO2525 family SAM-dependent methyltransferase [unclassified Streptomyces]MDQ0403691.1 hypothetical protein [Streptomyces sp. DSM 40167]
MTMDRNADAPWSKFDPEAYVDDNYRTPLEVDLLIVRLMRDHFTRCFADTPHPVRGIDVGAGANLYPALSMLPWCDKVLLLEYAHPNVEYLEKQVSPGGYDTAWDAFWKVLGEEPAYRAVEPRELAGEIVRVERGNLFDLEHGHRRWGLGTMFFVADSMSECPEEFQRGVRCFMNALGDGAPFAAAFMKESVGYRVGAHDYPAYRVNEERVRESLAPFTGELEIHDLHHMVRPGHEGMLLALGRRNSEIATP